MCFRSFSTIEGATTTSSTNPNLETNDSTLTAAKDSLDFDTTLEDVVITAQKKLVESDGATLTYNVSEDPESKVSTTLEILRKVPGVVVDANEDIKVNGQSSFKIYLNGREDPMLSGDVKNILKSMPASTIKKIEVISEPGAKYEAEGSGGILNIVTESKQRLEGYLATINAGITTSGSVLSGYARTKLNKVTASVQASYNNNFLEKHRHSYSTVESDNYTSDIYHRQINSTVSNNKGGNYTYGSLNLSWEPDTLNLFTLSAHINDYEGKYFSDMNTTMYDINGEKVYSFSRDIDMKYQDLGVSAQASYQHTFKREGHNIILTYSFSRYNNNNTYSNYDEIDNYPYLDYIWSRDMNESNNNSHIVQLDYYNKISKKHIFEAGLKGNFKTNHGNTAPWYGYTDNVDDLAIDATQQVKLKQFNDIFALYGSYTGNFNKWSTRIGLRYEYTHRGIKYQVCPDGYSNFTNILNDFVPNASITYKFTDSSNIRAAYQLRIARPGISTLNPYSNTLNPGHINYGNPDLDSEKLHRLSLAYSNYMGKLSGSFKTTYSFSNNEVTDIIFSDPQYIYSTYTNCGKTKSISFEANLNWSPTSRFNAGLWINEEYYNAEANSELLHAKQIGWTTNLNGNINYTLPCKIRLGAYCGYGSGWLDLQSKGYSWYYYSLSVGRSFLKEDALTVNVFAQNFFNPRRKSNYEQVSETARNYVTRDYANWAIGMSISWKFGSLGSDVKRTRANIEEAAEASGSSKGAN